MKVKNQVEYDAWKAKNAEGEDPAMIDYAQGVFRYAERWADLMEAEIEGGRELEDVARECDRQANTEGITGFQYGVAVSILANCWVHGDQLRRWHNLEYQIGDEGERANESGGVLNPALLNLGPKEGGGE